MRILKFKSQLTIALFAAVNHLNGPLRKQNFTLTGSKGHGFWFVIGGFLSVLCISVFQGSLLLIVIMIRQRKTQFWRWLLNFRVHMFVKSAVSLEKLTCMLLKLCCGDWNSIHLKLTKIMKKIIIIFYYCFDYYFTIQWSVSSHEFSYS